MNTIKHIIAVASGKGGVGKSTTAVNLALALQSLGARVGLLDADIYGPSQQKMLGIADDVKPEQQGGQYLLPVMAHGLKTMSMGYLANDKTPMVWRGPMAGGALVQMLEQTLWGELDYLVIDMPPGTGDIQLTLIPESHGLRRGYRHDAPGHSTCWMPRKVSRCFARSMCRFSAS